VTGYTLLQHNAWGIPLVDVSLSELDREFLRECGVTPDIRAEWQPSELLERQKEF